MSSVVKKSTFHPRQCAIPTALESARSYHKKSLCPLCLCGEKFLYQPHHRAIPTDLESAPPHHKKSLCPLCLCGEKTPYHPRQSAIPARFTSLESTLSYQKSLCPLCLCGEKRPLTPDKAPFPLTSNPRPPTKTLGALGVLGGKKPVLGPTNRPTPRYSSLPCYKEHVEIR